MHGDLNKCIVDVKDKMAISSKEDARGYINLIISGDRSACRRFVDDYTDMVLWKIRDLMRTHCNYLAGERVCALLILQKGRKGGALYSDRRDQCDECMDSYIWLFEYIKKRLKAYRGTNNCSLKTYVWSIINSHTTYIDWLRWRYGRVF